MNAQADATTKARPGLATALKLLAALIGLAAVGTLVWDIVDPPVPGGTVASQQGQSIGFSIGTVVRTAILGVIAGSLFLKARALANPGRFGATAVARDELAEIATALRDRAVPEPTGATGFYAQHSDADLVSVYRHIRADTSPQRFHELVLEIRRRSPPG